MTIGLNKVTLIGNVGNAPETKSNNGSNVTVFSLATEGVFKDKETGEKTKSTEWHRIVAYGAISEIVSNYVERGARLYVEGSIKTSSWKDKDGNDRKSYNIVAKNIIILSEKKQQEFNSGDLEKNRRPTTNYSLPKKQQPEKNQDQSSDFDLDDIPF